MVISGRDDFRGAEMKETNKPGVSDLTRRRANRKSWLFLVLAILLGSASGDYLLQQIAQYIRHLR